MTKKKSDNDLVLDHYYKGRATHFLDQVLMPLIKDSVKKPPADDVAGPGEVQYVVTALRGAELRDASTLRTSKFSVN